MDDELVADTLMGGMFRMHRVVCLLLVSLAITPACAKTRMSSLVAPEAHGKVYQRILVLFSVTDLEWRKTLEEEFNKAYKGDPLLFVPSYAFFFPGRQYSEDEVNSILEQQRIDAALMVIPGETGVTTARTPTQTTASCTLWNSAQGCVQASAITTGGYNVSKPWAQFTAVLIDLDTRLNVWTASAQTGGNAFAGTGTLLRSMANKTVDQLRADGLVP